MYQAETYRLPQALRGVHCIAFSLTEKVHLKGFSFTRQSRALRQNLAVDADQLYGDSFEKRPDAVRHIGNNVTMRFEHMEFPEAGSAALILDGFTPLKTTQVSLRVTGPDGEARSFTCAFRGSERGEQAFPVAVPKGLCAVDFVFLPGSDFDFYGFRFEYREP